MSLTVKQNAFCMAYIESGNASEAYRQAYDAQNMKAATVNRKAFELTENGKIRARLDELRNQHSARHVVTIDSLIDELETTRKTALSADTPQCTAALNATMGKAKLLGFDRQVVESTVSPQKTLSDIQDVTPTRERVRQILQELEDEY
jgi:phage terminase small subunit